MNQTEKSIYASDKHKTHAENMEKFYSYVAESVGKDKNERERIYNDKLQAMSVPSMKQEMVTYHEQISSAGVFTNKTKILEETVLNMYYHQCLGVTESKQFADRLKADNNFKQNTVKDDVKNLLSGTTIYSIEVSAKEAKALRETIVTQDKQINLLTTQNQDLGTKLEKVNKALTNIVSNLKTKLGFSEDKINDLLNTPAEKDKTVDLSKSSIKTATKDFDISR